MVADFKNIVIGAVLAASPRNRSPLFPHSSHIHPTFITLYRPHSTPEPTHFAVCRTLLSWLTKLDYSTPSIKPQESK
jgi:hypothetical protein